MHARRRYRKMRDPLRRLAARERRSLVLLSCLLFVSLACLGPYPAEARILRVPGEYFTIQEALDAASAGDRVEVANGAYRQTVTLRPGVTLESAGGRDSCALLPVPGSFAMVTAESLSSKAAIRGFTLDGRREVRQGVRLVASEVDIMDNRIQDANVVHAMALIQVAVRLA